HDELGVAALDQIAQLARSGSGIGFGIFGGELHLATGNTTTLVDDVDGGLGALVVPKPPRGDHAGEIAVMTDDNRSGSLGKQILGDRQAGRAGQRASLESGIKEAAAAYFSLLHAMCSFRERLSHCFDSPR